MRACRHLQRHGVQVTAACRSLQMRAHMYTGIGRHRLMYRCWVDLQIPSARLVEARS
jgi:hypothetical protein